MDDDSFWQLISRANRAPAGRFDKFVAELEALPPGELLDFIRKSRLRVIDAYDYHLWAAAYIIDGGCSDDSFQDFRESLVLMGRQVYEAALRDPDSLADVPETGDDDFFDADIGGVPYEIYSEKMGMEVPDEAMPPYPRKPKGEPFDPNEVKAMAARFPRLSAKYRYLDLNG